MYYRAVLWLILSLVALSSQNLVTNTSNSTSVPVLNIGVIDRKFTDGHVGEDRIWEIARQDVNRHFSDVFEIRFTYFDIALLSQVEWTEESESLHQYWFSGKLREVMPEDTVAFVGLGWSSLAIMLGHLVGGRPWSCRAANVPGFEDRDKYPSTFSTKTPQAGEGLAAVDVVKLLGYDKVKLVSCYDSYCQGIVGKFKTRSVEAGLSIVDEFVIEAGFSDDFESVQQIKDFLTVCSETRVLVMIAGRDDWKVLSAAKTLGVIEDLIVVSIADGDEDSDGHISIQAGPTYSNASWELRAHIWTQMGFDIETIPNDGSSVFDDYDSLLTLAHALASVIRSGQSPSNSTAVIDAVRTEVRFEGASGTVGFDDLLFRPEIPHLISMQVDGILRPLIRWHPDQTTVQLFGNNEKDRTLWLKEEVPWPHHVSTRPPSQYCFSRNFLFGALFAYRTHKLHLDMKRAAEVAVEWVNQQAWLLPGVQVDMRTIDTSNLVEADGSRGSTELDSNLIDIREKLMHSFIEELKGTDTCLQDHRSAAAIIGPGSDSEALLMQSSLVLVDTLAISPSSADPQLSDQSSHPMLIRMAPSDEHQGYALADFVHRHRWMTCILVTSHDPFSESLASTFKSRTALYGIVVTEYGFQTFKNEMESLRSSCGGSRVVVLLVEARQAQELWGYSNLGGGGGFIWLGHKNLYDRLWSKEQSEGGIPTGSFLLRPALDPSTGIFEQFREFWDLRHEDSALLLSEPRAAAAADSVIALARALHDTVVSGLSVDNTSHVKAMLSALDFEGVSGPVSFQKLHREGVSYEIWNCQGQLSWKHIAHWDGSKIVEKGSAITWPDNTESGTVICPDPPPSPIPTSCPPGWALNVGVCSLCKNNTYKSQESCYPCPAGTTFSGVGANIFDCQPQLLWFALAGALISSLWAALQLRSDSGRIFQRVLFLLDEVGLYRFIVSFRTDLALGETHLWKYFASLTLILLAALFGATQGILVAQIGSSTARSIPLYDSTADWLVAILLWMVAWVATTAILLVVLSTSSWPAGRYICEAVGRMRFESAQVTDHPSKYHGRVMLSQYRYYVIAPLTYSSPSVHAYEVEALANRIAAIAEVDPSSVELLDGGERTGHSPSRTTLHSQDRMSNVLDTGDESSRSTQITYQVTLPDLSACLKVKGKFARSTRRTAQVYNSVAVCSWARWTASMQGDGQRSSSVDDPLVNIHPCRVFVRPIDKLRELDELVGLLPPSIRNMFRISSLLYFRNLNRGKHPAVEIALRAEYLQTEEEFSPECKMQELRLLCSPTLDGFDNAEKRSWLQPIDFDRERVIVSRLREAQHDGRAQQVILPFLLGFLEDVSISKGGSQLWSWLLNKFGRPDRSIYVKSSPIRVGSPAVPASKTFLPSDSLQQRIDKGERFDESRIAAIGISVQSLLRDLHHHGMKCCALDPSCLMITQGSDGNESVLLHDLSNVYCAEDFVSASMQDLSSGDGSALAFVGCIPNVFSCFGAVARGQQRSSVSLTQRMRGRAAAHIAKNSRVRVYGPASSVAPELLSFHVALTETGQGADERYFEDHSTDVFLTALLMHRLLTDNPPLKGVCESTSAADTLQLFTALQVETQDAQEVDRDDNGRPRTTLEELRFKDVRFRAKDLTVNTLTNHIGVADTFFNKDSAVNTAVQLKKFRVSVLGHIPEIKLKLSKIEPVDVFSEDLLNALNVPSRARFFSFCYPVGTKDGHDSLQAQCELLDVTYDDPTILWLDSAFIFISEDNEVLAIKACDWAGTGGEQTASLNMEVPSSILASKLKALEGSWAPIPETFPGQRLTHFCWISASESHLGGLNSRQTNGGFALKHVDPLQSKFVAIRRSFVNWNDCSVSREMKALLEGCMSPHPKNRTSMERLRHALKERSVGFDVLICVAGNEDAKIGRLLASSLASHDSTSVIANARAETRSKDGLMTLMSSKSVVFVPIISASLTGELAGYKYDVYILGSSKPFGAEVCKLLCTNLSSLSVDDRGHKRKLKVYWDQQCLLPGQDRLNCNLDALKSSSVVVPVMCEQALQQTCDVGPNTMNRMLLEIELCIHLQRLGRVLQIHPVWVGQIEDNSIQQFQQDLITKCPAIVVRAVADKARQVVRKDEYLWSLYKSLDQGDTAAPFASRTVKESFEILGMLKGSKPMGNRESELQKAAHGILDVVHNVLRTTKTDSSTSLMYLQIAAKLKQLGRLRKIIPVRTKQAVNQELSLFLAEREEGPDWFYQHAVWKASGNASKSFLRSHSMQETIIGTLHSLLGVYLKADGLVVGSQPQEVVSDEQYRLLTEGGEDLAEELLKRSSASRAKGKPKVENGHHEDEGQKMTSISKILLKTVKSIKDLGSPISARLCRSRSPSRSTSRRPSDDSEDSGPKATSNGLEDRQDDHSRRSSFDSDGKASRNGAVNPEMPDTGFRDLHVVPKRQNSESPGASGSSEDSNRRLEPTGPQVPIPSRASLVSADEGTEKDGFGILEIAEITEELTTSVKAPA